MEGAMFIAMFIAMAAGCRIDVAQRYAHKRKAR
jgi:hypothetical protein